MSRIALRCALATAFTALSGIAVVYSGDRDQPMPRTLSSASVKPIADAREQRAPVQQVRQREHRDMGDGQARLIFATYPTPSGTYGATTGSAPELTKVTREVQLVQQRRGALPVGRENVPAASSSAIPLVSIAEALLVRFQGFAELSGVYRINEDDTIAIPGIGRMELSSMPVEQLETMLSKRILSLTGREGQVSIEVERYRHVFVTGDVANPGSFNWFRGMTVLKAMSIAGGYAKQEAREEAEDKGDMVALQLARSLSRHARLGAEMAGSNQIQVPERLIGLCGQFRARELINAEEALLGVRRGSRLASLKAIEAGAKASATEIARLKDLQKALDERVARYAEHTQSLDRLHRTNVVTKQRLMDVETSLAELSERRAGAKVQLARAVAEEVQLVRQRIELEEAYRARISEELAETWGKIEELQLELDKARPSGSSFQREQVAMDPALIKSRMGLTNGGNSNDAAPSGFVIVRRNGDSEVRLAARDVDSLRPGDMVIVTRAAVGADGTSPVVRRTCGGSGPAPNPAQRG